MKLVFVTQVLDRGDAVLGFVHRWVQGLARYTERVRVLALEVGDTSDLPPNVDWRELGRRGRLVRWLRYRRALADAFGRDGFDGLLTHMVPRYSLVAAGPARRAGVPHYLWYTHAGVDARLRRAEAVVDGIFTASEESLRLATPKRIVTGHGIDVAHFAPLDPSDGRSARSHGARLLSVGRLTPSKDPLTILDALGLLVAEGRDVHLDWAGGGLARGDDDYGAAVRERARALGLEARIRWLGAVPYADVPRVVQAADVFVSASRTGSVDKVVLEAMAAGVPVVTSNESFPPLFARLDALVDPRSGQEATGGVCAGASPTGPVGGRIDGRVAPLAPRLVAPAGDARGFARAIAAWLDLDAGARAAAGARLRDFVAREHAVDPLMARLVAHMQRGATAVPRGGAA